MHWFKVSFIAFLSSQAISFGAYKDDVRHTELSEELNLRGETLPTGQGVTVTQVEAPNSSSNYFPDSSNSEFAGKTLNDLTGTAAGSSGHATTVGKNLYGLSSSMAPSIGTVDVFEANDFLNNHGWYSGTPSTESNPLQNHSWVNESDNNLGTVRMDYAVKRDGFLPIFGIKNTSTTGDSDIPPFYASAYNGISVGLSSGNHRTGVTTSADGPGRVKPEIVAPSGATSYATPMVTAAAAMLIEAAGTDTDAKDELTLKAILLAAADKSPFTDWDQTETRPIDDIYGAGQLDVYEAYFIQQAGQQTTGSNISKHGWDLNTLGSNGSTSYLVNIPSGYELRNLSVLLTWNRDVSRSIIGKYSYSLADMSLSLVDSSDDSVIQLSDSSVDNIEHIWRDSNNGLSAGSYTLELSTDNSVEYAIAWRAELYQDYTLWSSVNFTETTPVEERDPEDDPDGDGLTNEMERALNADPETASTTELPTLTVTTVELDEYLEITFLHPNFDNGLTYTVETTDDLTGTSWSSDTVDVDIVSRSTVSSTLDQVTYRRLQPVSGNATGFLRLNIAE